MSIKQPLISVIMPVYNAERYIKRSLESMLNQTYSNLEILIGNDASRDNSIRIIENYQDNRIKVFDHDENLGYVKNCNALFEKATGDFIAFQDADDYSSLDKLEKQLGAFRNDPSLGVCGTNFIAYEEDGQPIFCSNYSTTHEDIWVQIPGYFPVKPSSFLLKREVYDTIGGYHTYWNRIGCEDYYWFAHIIKNFKCQNLQKPLYHYVYSSGSITRTIDTPRKLYVNELLQFLVRQLKTTGSDFLMKEDLNALNAEEERLAQPFREDSSYFPLRLAVTSFDQKHYKEAVLHMLRAVRKNPMKWYNYRTLFYFFRQGLWQTLRNK